MADNPHFESARNWEAAGKLLTFDPVQPRRTAGLRLQALRIFVRDYKMREVPVGDRTLEAHYGGFVLSQKRCTAAEARRQALDVSYGRDGREIQIAGHAGKVYELGPEPPPDDIDGRSDAVVVWHEGEMFYLVASGEMQAEELVKIAQSIYKQRRLRP